MKKRLIAALAAIGMITTMSACSSAGDGGSGDSLKIGNIAGATATVPDVIAEKQGFFTKHGLDVQLVNASNGPGLVTLLLSGGTDITWAPTSVVLAATTQRAF